MTYEQWLFAVLGPLTFLFGMGFWLDAWRRQRQAEKMFLFAAQKFQHLAEALELFNYGAREEAVEMLQAAVREMETELTELGE